MHTGLKNPATGGTQVKSPAIDVSKKIKSPLPLPKK